jgi:outer membrane lipoprotein-sorting protein
MRGRCSGDNSWHRFAVRTLGGMLAVTTVLSVFSTWGQVRAHAFVQVLNDMQRAYAWVDHYTATFLVQERLHGELGPEHEIALKFKKPFHVYMRWVKGPNEGRQALYPAGPDGNELWVRVRTLVGAVTVSLDPNSARARKGSRHPITDVGIGRVLDFLADDVQRGMREEVVMIDDAGSSATLDRPTHRYALHFPREQDKGYHCMVAVIDIDRELRLPIYIEIYDWTNQLVERYGYRDLHLNPGLTDEDFAPKNPAYGF